jgi:cell division septal protein FtsQ
MIGTDVDSFVRDFFITDDEGKFLFDKNAIDYSKYPTLSKSVLDEMVKGLTVLKQQMLDRGETRIISEEVITDGNIKVKLQDGRTIEVPNTGHLDMMTVDNMGKVHIYDMKSFRSDDDF